MWEIESQPFIGNKLWFYTHVISQIRFPWQVIINHKFASIKYDVNQFGWSWTDFEMYVSLFNKELLIGCRILKIWQICHQRGPSLPKTNIQIYFIFPPPSMLIKTSPAAQYLSSYISIEEKSYPTRRPW